MHRRELYEGDLSVRSLSARLTLARRYRAIADAGASFSEAFDTILYAIYIPSAQTRTTESKISISRH